MPLTPNAKVILEKARKLNPDGEYIFMHRGKQLSKETFNKHLKRYCEALNIEYRSSHQIRFTVASILYKNGIPATQLQQWLGHSQLSMTLHYLRNATSNDEVFNTMVSALG